jgi:GNAT superfamily N-acetyltransferase
MADAIVEIVGQDDLPVIVDLYNQVYRPSRDVDSFRRRFRGRYNILRMIARIKDQPVGFFLGFELKPTTYFAWFYGVLPEFRRQGIATQLMEAVHAWARESEYESVRLECHNAARSMLHLAIALDYIVAGIRWDPDRGDNLVIFEKTLND